MIITIIITIIVIITNTINLHQVDQLRQQTGEQLALVASLARREDQTALR